MPPKKAVTKKAAKALLKQEKKEQKQKEKETKHKLKCEAFLSKALMKYEQTGHEADVQYICDQLQQTPQWVGPLARLIRHGALNALLKLNSGQEETTDGPERWQGKARKLLELPEAAKIRMLEECGVNLTHVKCDTDSLNSTFAMHFWVTENVPLPSQPDIRLMSTLVALAHARMAALPMAYFKEKDPTENNVKAMWQLEGNVLTWLYNDSREALPELQDGEWELTDPQHPNCQVVSSQKKKLTFQARDFFSLVEECDPDMKWKFEISDPADASKVSAAPTLRLKVKSPQKV